MRFFVKKPILGFEDIKEMELEKIDDIFMSLKDVKSDILFTLINPLSLRNYKIEIPKKDRELLEIEDGNSVLILNTIILNSPIEESEINFLAPFVFNTQKRVMAQIILDSSKYPDFKLTDKISRYLKKG